MFSANTFFIVSIWIKETPNCENILVADIILLEYSGCFVKLQERLRFCMLNWVTNSWIKENTFRTYAFVFLSQSIAFLVYKTHCYSLLSSCLQRFWKQTSFFAELSIFKWVIIKIHRYKNAMRWAKIIKMA